MQNELTDLQPQLVKTVGEVEELMVRIGKEKAEVVEPKAEVCFSSCLPVYHSPWCTRPMPFESFGWHDC